MKLEGDNMANVKRTNRSAVLRNLHENGPVGVMTDYEEKFHALGTPINRCECVVRSRPAPKELIKGGSL